MHVPCSLMALTRLVCAEAFFTFYEEYQVLPVLQELSLQRIGLPSGWLSFVMPCLPNLTSLEFRACENEEVSQNAQQLQQISTLRSEV